ncbi:malate:quinone oxidoreductase [Klebsiella pneumoniae]|uniref:Malate:quinone oxidoreductase n=1 Tax=Klebsiella pneumoniae TaxID=573 RepID=A0A377TUD8_KLEPN|nr:malate:quinone oxidoreductase [Klebsiella pneumoniae]
MPAMKKTIISLTALAMFVSAATHAEADTSKKTDFLLIGGGIISASLAPGFRRCSRTGI